MLHQHLCLPLTLFLRVHVCVYVEFRKTPDSNDVFIARAVPYANVLSAKVDKMQPPCLCVGVSVCCDAAN